MMIQNPMELYDEVMKVAKHEEVSYWVNDLQCKVTPQITEIINQYVYKHLVTIFKSVIDGCLWYEIPFAYKPWWEGGDKNETV